MDKLYKEIDCMYYYSSNFKNKYGIHKVYNKQNIKFFRKIFRNITPNIHYDTLTFFQDMNRYKIHMYNDEYFIILFFINIFGSREVTKYYLVDGFDGIKEISKYIPSLSLVCKKIVLV